MTKELLLDIIKNGESINVEFKSCKDKISSTVYESVCAFLNRSGGHIIIGVEDNGEISGVNLNNADAMVKNFIHVISDPKLFLPGVYIAPEIIEVDDKKVIYCYVEEGQNVHRFKNAFYDRNGDADINISNNPGLLSSLFARKSTVYSENRIIPHLTLEDLDNDTFDYCRRSVQLINPVHAWISLSNEDILKSIGLYGTDTATGEKGLKLAALLLFAKESAIADFYPIYRIDAIYRNYTHQNYIDNKTNSRYDDRETIRTNLIQAYKLLIEFIQKHLPDKFYIEEGQTQRIDLRINIFREVIANLIVHREYANPSAGTLEIFSDRVITSNWSKHSPTQKTGKIGIDDLVNQTKNPLLVKTFRELGLVEELGSGSRNIKKYAPLYYEGSIIEITNAENFIFSITYQAVDDSVKTTDLSVKTEPESVKRVNINKQGVKMEPESVNSDDNKDLIQHFFMKLKEGPTKASDKNLRRLSQVLAIIEQEGSITRQNLCSKLNRSNSQIKTELITLQQMNLVALNKKESTYYLI